MDGIEMEGNNKVEEGYEEGSEMESTGTEENGVKEENSGSEKKAHGIRIDFERILSYIAMAAMAIIMIFIFYQITAR